MSAFPLASRFGLARGFDVYDDRFLQRRGGAWALRRGAAQAPRTVVGRPASGWPTGAGAAFLWVHLYEPHFPYRASGAFRLALPGRPLRRRGGGDGCRARARCIGPLLGRGPVRANARRASPATTANRGASTGRRPTGSSPTKGRSACRSSSIVRASCGPRRVDGPVRHVDIVPTVLDAIAAAGSGGPGRPEPARPSSDGASSPALVFRGPVGDDESSLGARSTAWSGTG